MPVFLTPAGKQSSVVGSLAENQRVFHWHGETFDVPAGATHLAFSDHCANQAFIFKDHVLALQFHPEVTPEIVQDMVMNEVADITTGPAIHRAQKILADAALANNNDELISRIMTLFFECDS